MNPPKLNFDVGKVENKTDFFFVCFFVLGWGFQRGVSTEHVWEESSRVEGGGRGQDRKSYSSPLPPPAVYLKKVVQIERERERGKASVVFSPSDILVF